MTATRRKTTGTKGKGPADIKAAIDAGNPAEALRIAAGFPFLGEHKDTIQKGWSAYRNPDMYREMGHNPEELFNAAINAVKARYGVS